MYCILAPKYEILKVTYKEFIYKCMYYDINIYKYILYNNYDYEHSAKSMILLKLL